MGIINGLDGKKVGVAVLDTGIYPHMDFDDRIICFADFVNNRGKPYDDNSHGTHVAGIIGGSGVASNGRYCGINRECSLIGIKVLDRNGNGKIERVIKALAWVVANSEKYNIRVLNISFGADDEDGSNEKILIKAVEKVWDSGIVVVTAAGNMGPEHGTITVPGTSRKVITVGVVDDYQYTDSKGVIHYNYSGRGPTKEAVMKPEIVTSGSGIISCNNTSKGYSVKSGTSMAAPIVSGSISRLLALYPDMTPDQVKFRLYKTAIPLKLEAEHQGWGLFNQEQFCIL